MTWKLQTDETLDKRIITYPKNTPLPGKVVRLRASGKTLIVQGRARGQGTTGTVVRIAPQRHINAGDVEDKALTKSSIVRYQLFWLFRSARGLLALGTVVFLIAGTVLHRRGRHPHNGYWHRELAPRRSGLDRARAEHRRNPGRRCQRTLHRVISAHQVHMAPGNSTGQR